MFAPMFSAAPAEVDLKPVPAILRTFETASCSVTLLAEYGLQQEHWNDDAPLQLSPTRRARASIRNVRRLEFAPAGDEFDDDE